MKIRKGISLMVLVITIIVMIILAGTVIISLSNDGIIDKANEAVDKTNDKQIQELVSLAWAEAYADNIGLPKEKLQVKLQEGVEKALSDNNLDKEDYGMQVTMTGVTIIKGWLQTNDRTVVKGSTRYDIGDNINYDETNGNTINVTKDVDWYVLGAENGQLILVSSENILKKYWGGDDLVQKGQERWLNVKSDFNKLCESYSKGKNVVEARCITVEDVDKITGYDKYSYTYSYDKYTTHYGDKVTYYWDSTNTNENYPYCEVSSGSNTKLSGNHKQFIWHNGNTWKEENIPTVLSSTKQKICTVETTYYKYDVDVETNLKKSSKEYKMMFGENDEQNYWLASTSVYARVFCLDYQVMYVKNGMIQATSFVSSTGGAGGGDFGFRVVVKLSSEFSI